jgi:Ni/Co efflux regulator RcnB
MRKLLLLLAVAVAFSLSGFAQAASSGQTSTTNKDTTQTTTSKKTTKTKGAGTEAKESQLTGCLAKNAEGNGYVLTNGRYKKGVDVKSSEDMSAHVGHEVKLMGTWEKPPASAQKAGTTSEPRTFNATSLKHISDTCKASAAAGEKKGGKKAATEKTPGL